MPSRLSKWLSKKKADVSCESENAGHTTRPPPVGANTPDFDTDVKRDSTSLARNADEIFPDGLKTLADPQNASVDICFVHGLTGNRVSTWTANGQDKTWMQLFLPQKLPSARILTYGYDAYIVRGIGKTASSNRLSDHAHNLLNDLATDRDGCGASSRPLIFVAHSLGGLVCKEVLLIAKDNPEVHLQSVFSSARGIVFLGTPHQGSWMASWANIPARSLGVVISTNRSLLNILEESNEFLSSIQQKFLSMIRLLQQNNRQLHVACFYEELPLLAVGLVVPKDSATFPGYNAMSIHANHRDMVKFGSEDETGFKRVVGELVRWERDVRYLSDAAPYEPAQDC